MRLLFFGTPAFAVPSLEALLSAGHSIAAVVTQPDRPKGRGQHLAAPPVKVRAENAGVQVLQPARIRDDDTLGALEAFNADLAVVAAYGKLLPQRLLDMPRLGFLNVHASLLPRWRGAAPVHRSILAGDRQTGVTIMRVVLALDAGPMLSRVVTDIDPDETSETLERRLADLGARLLVGAIDDLVQGRASETAQDESAVTYAARLERADSAVDWARPAIAIHNQIRGLQPWPLAVSHLGGRRLLLRQSRVADDATGSDTSPGTIVHASDRLFVATGATGSDRLELRELQPEGRRPMSAAEFVRGHHVGVGDRFASAS